MSDDNKVRRDRRDADGPPLTIRHRSLWQEIVVETTGSEPSYDDFLSKLPAGSCRYAVYDFEYKQSEGEGIRNKLCFIAW